MWKNSLLYHIGFDTIGFKKLGRYIQIIDIINGWIILTLRLILNFLFSVDLQVIDKYNGRIIHGNRLVVEPWLELLASGAPRRRAPAPVTTVENSGMNPRAKPFVFPLSEAAGTREFIPRSMKEEQMEEDDLTF